MTPSIDLEAAKQLRFDEGDRAKPYADSRGNLTIGVGHNLSNGLSQAARDFIFTEDRAQVYAGLSRMLPWWEQAHPNAQLVLVNLAFNLGIGGLLAFHRFLHAMQFRQYTAAASALLDSLAARQLPNRYGRLAALLRSAKD